jgi:hypothetical protein
MAVILRIQFQVLFLYLYVVADVDTLQDLPSLHAVEVLDLRQLLAPSQRVRARLRALRQRALLVLRHPALRVLRALLELEQELHSTDSAEGKDGTVPSSSYGAQLIPVQDWANYMRIWNLHI